jgi:hypothetical protein
MISQSFVVPSDDEVLDATGLVPTSEDDFESKTLVLNLGGEDSLKFSYSVTGRSVRLVWQRRDRPVLDLFREGATRFGIDSRDARVTLRIEFDLEQARGAIDVVIREDGVEMQDRILLY